MGLLIGIWEVSVCHSHVSTKDRAGSVNTLPQHLPAVLQAVSRGIEPSRR